MRCDVSDCTELQRVVSVHCVAAVRHWGRCIGPLNGSHFFFQMWSVNDALQPCLLAGDSPAAGLGPLGPNRHSRNHGGELAGRWGPRAGNAAARQGHHVALDAAMWFAWLFCDQLRPRSGDMAFAYGAGSTIR